MGVLTTALIITIIISLIFIVIIVNESTATTMSNPNIKITTQNTIPTINGGGGGNQINKVTTESRIINIQLAQTGNEAEIYWEVQNGIGCCNTYQCNNTKFTEACIEPFILFDIYLDQQLIPVTGFRYTCAPVTPYNFFTFNNLARGTHIITVNQKECTDDTIDTQTIIFEVK